MSQLREDATAYEARAAELLIPAGSTVSLLLTNYEAAVARLDIYPEGKVPMDVFYAMGLCGEAGEVIDKLKKRYRGYDGITDLSIAVELGDVLWYLVREANRLGFTLAEIMLLNLDKLHARMARGTTHGEGDNR